MNGQHETILPRKLVRRFRQLLARIRIPGTSLGSAAGAIMLELMVWRILFVVGIGIAASGIRGVAI